MSYNGWENYETWAANLWLGESFYEMSRNYAKGQEYELSQALKDLVEEFSPQMKNSLYSDLLTAAMSEINWLEIAESHLSEE